MRCRTSRASGDAEDTGGRSGVYGVAEGGGTRLRTPSPVAAGRRGRARRGGARARARSGAGTGRTRDRHRGRGRAARHALLLDGDLLRRLAAAADLHGGRVGRRGRGRAGWWCRPRSSCRWSWARSACAPRARRRAAAPTAPAARLAAARGAAQRRRCGSAPGAVPAAGAAPPPPPATPRAQSRRGPPPGSPSVAAPPPSSRAVPPASPSPIENGPSPRMPSATSSARTRRRRQHGRDDSTGEDRPGAHCTRFCGGIPDHWTFASIGRHGGVRLRGANPNWTKVAERSETNP